MRTTAERQDRIDATSSQLERLERLQAYYPSVHRARTIERLRAELDVLTRIKPAELERCTCPTCSEETTAGEEV